MFIANISFIIVISNVLRVIVFSTTIFIREILGILKRRGKLFNNLLIAAKIYAYVTFIYDEVEICWAKLQK